MSDVEYVRECVRCGDFFRPRAGGKPQKYCGPKCSWRHRNKVLNNPETWTMTNCQICGDSIDPRVTYDGRWGNSVPRMYCSRQCKEKKLRDRRRDASRVTRRSHLKRYGLTPDSYQELWVQQGGRCAICRNPESKIVRGTLANLSVDHDHQTGQVRGLLCSLCNVGLGTFLDDPVRVEAALAYLRGAMTADANDNPV